VGFFWEISGGATCDTSQGEIAREVARERGIPEESDLGKPDNGDLASSAGGHAPIAMTKATLHTIVYVHCHQEER
jgi:hypothetical protein